MIKEIVEINPEVITVFTVEKAREISGEAEKQGKVQDIILKVIDRGDLVYEGQRGGFRKSELIEAAKKIMEYRGVRIIGLTSFPCLLYDSQGKRVVETHNVKTLLDSTKILERDLGLELKQINFPSANSVSTISTIKELGGTHGEPGHAFTGTIPINAHIDQPEIPAMVYISEISHIYGDEAYAYGGGYYRRGNIERAIVGPNLEKGLDNILKVADISPTNIDYYGGLELGNRKVSIGDTVVYAFRTQIFVTRSEVALVRSISSGDPKLIGIYDSLGNRLK